MRLGRLVATVALVLIASAALAEVKWEQYPDPGGSQWMSQLDVCQNGWTAEMADDFLCEDGFPITAVEWWGTAAGMGNLPDHYLIKFYSDVPAGTGGIAWSRPGDLLYEEECWDFTAVWDEDLNQFRFSQDLAVPFCQELGTIYWFSVVGVVCSNDDVGAAWCSSTFPQWNDLAVIRTDIWGYPEWTALSHYYGGYNVELSFVLHGGPPFTPNVVCDPDLLQLNKVGPSGTIDVNYLGGGSGPVGAYSVTVSWDDTVVDLTGITEGSLLLDAGATLFMLIETSNSVTVDCALQGGVPGVSGPGTMFTLNFDADGDGTSTVDISSLDFRESNNDPLCAFYEDDGEIEVERTDPTSSVDPLSLYQTVLTFPVAYTADDGAGSGVASVELFYQMDGGGYSSYGSFAYPSSPISFTAGGDGFYEFYTVATDNAGNVETPPPGRLVADASTTVDTTLPTSSVDALPTYQTALTFSVAYTSDDSSGSGVASVELFYQVGGTGGYSSYGSFAYPSSPISFTAGGDGFYEFYTVATDNASNVEAAPGTPPDASTTVDTAAPGNITGFAAAPAHEEVDLSWDDPTGLDTNYLGVVVRYDAWGDYPYYSTSAPAYPVDETSGDGEAFDGTGLVTGATHSIVDRDIYYYSAFVYDEALHYGGADSGGQDRSTNYWLGDVANTGDLWVPDGLVTTHDINKLGGTYGVSPAGFNNSECDVGPTDDRSRVGVPTPDAMIDFEDLMIFSMNYGVVSAKIVPFLGEPVAGDLALALVENGRTNGGVIELALRLEGNLGDVKGLTAELEFEGLEFLSARLSDEMSVPVADVFFWSNATSHGVQVDAAVLGTDVTIGGSGDVVLFSFRVLDETYSVDFTSATLRGAANEDLTAELEGLSSDLVPVAFKLVQNNPNPFNPVTRIAYHVPSESRVTIRVFDVTGRLVATLVDGVVEPGRHAAVWNGTNDRGESVSSGVYFCTMETPDYRGSHKMTLLK